MRFWTIRPQRAVRRSFPRSLLLCSSSRATQAASVMLCTAAPLEDPISLLPQEKALLRRTPTSLPLLVWHAKTTTLSNLISQRTKEALARKRAEGVVLGRPKGRKPSHTKLTGKENTIRELLSQNVSKSQIAKIFKVNRSTVLRFIQDNNLEGGETNVEVS